MSFRILDACTLYGVDLLSEYAVALFVTDLGVQVKQAMENLFKNMKARLV